MEFARALHERKVEILSTGGTAKLLAQNGIGVTEVADYTGFPEMLDGRVKTLHPKVHGGILGRRDLKTHAEAMQKHGIPPIDLVVVNLYPFEQTVAKPNCPLDEAIENIDIGGPTLLRAAAKNHGAVTVVVDNADYSAVLDEMKSNKGRHHRSHALPARGQGVRAHRALRRRHRQLARRDQRRRRARCVPAHL